MYQWLKKLMEDWLESGWKNFSDVTSDGILNSAQSELYLFWNDWFVVWNDKWKNQIKND